MNPKLPNIIVFLVDDQAWSGTSIHKYHPYRADSCSDYFEMPNLQRLAREGIRFTDMYAPAPLCAPARIGIQLGRSPVSLRATTFCGIRRDGGILQKREAHHLSIPELIKRDHPEYVAAHFGKWHIYGHKPAELGYDESSGPTDNQGWSPTHTPEKQDPKRIFDVTAQASRFIQENVQRDRPFFLQVSHYALHTPIECRSESRRHFNGKRAGWKYNHPEYAAMTADLDDSLGQILDLLDILHIRDNTYVVYLSDNGGNACDDVSLTNLNLPLRKGKQFLHEGGIRVPFVVRGPRIPADSVCMEPAISYDLLPTFADLLGMADLPRGIEGASLRTAMEKPLSKFHRATEPKPLPPVIRRERDFFVWHAPYRVPGYSYYRESAIRRGKYKLLKNWDGDFLELYDLEVDMEERVNLVSQKPELARELEKLLLDYLRDVNAKMDVAPFLPSLWERWQQDDESLSA